MPTAHKSALYSLFSDAMAQCRSEYREYLEGFFQQAHEACNGTLLNREGRTKRIDPFMLFTQSPAFTKRWASEELMDYLEEHPRMTFAAFEKSWAESWNQGGHR